jgi:hypothetical protein
MKLHILLLCLLATQLGLSQSKDSSETSLTASLHLRSMVEKTFFTSVEIKSTSTVNAIQQLCDLIGEKQSIENEKKLRFILEGSPNDIFHRALTQK